MKKYILLSVACMVVTLGISQLAFCAQGENRGPRNGIAKALVFESLSKGEKEKLLKLRKENREEFRKILDEKLEQKKTELETLKKENPEKFKALIASTRQKMHTRMEELRRKDPQKFQQLQKMRREKMQQRLKELKEKDPQRYEQVRSHMEQRRQHRMHQGEGNNTAEGTEGQIEM